MKKIIYIVLAIIVLVGGYMYIKNSNQVMAPAPQSATDTTATVKNLVTLTDAGYSPASITVLKGETVTFKNSSSKSMWTASAMHPAHTGYSGTSLSEHCPDVANTSFDACRGYLPGESWSFKFNKVGTWGYHNHLSPKEWGTVVVQ